jgi:hypothetical protein
MSEQLHRSLTLADVSRGDASIVRCPDCGQLEIWSLEEIQHHGKCRASTRPCWCEEPGSEPEVDTITAQG